MRREFTRRPAKTFPETPSTKYMFKAEQFAQMKPGSILMNASRGTVVDIDALADALGSGKLLGAAIDVFPVEPKSNNEEFISPLREFDNVILTPHLAWWTKEAFERVERDTLSGVREILAGDRPENLKNVEVLDP